MKGFVRKLRRQKGRVVWGLVGVVVLVLLVILFYSIMKDDELTFEEGFTRIEEASKSHGTSFRDEELEVKMVNFKEIDPLIDELKEVVAPLTARLDRLTREEVALLRFSEIRLLMLVSQKNYYTAVSQGPGSLVSNTPVIDCNKAPFMMNAAYYLNQSFGAGLQAELLIDDLLVEFSDVPKVWELVGVDKNKTRFFRSDLRKVKNIAKLTGKVLEEECGVDMSGGFRPVNVEVVRS